MKLTATILSRLVKLSLLLTLAVSASVNAAPIINGSLGLTGGNPDIQSNYLSFDYVAGSNLFNVNGIAEQLTYNSVSGNILNGTFSITGTADGSDAILGLTIEGDVGSGVVETLLTGTLSAMSNSGFGDFEFLFGGLGGSLASLFGTEAGVIFSDFAIPSFDFSADVSTVETGVSDTFAVSAPSTFSLSVLGLVLLAIARRKRV